MDDYMVNDPQNQIVQMQKRIVRLENEVRKLRKVRGSVSNLQSPNFMTRAFAVWGHYFVAQLIIALVIFLVTFCLSIALGGSLFGALGAMNY